MWEAKSHAKINVFLKVTGRRGSYHELLSRFVQLPQLYDTIKFEQADSRSGLEITGKFSCSIENNSIFKAYRALLEQVSDLKTMVNFFSRYKVVVDKRIKEGGGLGGGPSNAAAFLKMTNDACRLGFTVNELANIGSFVGADVPFFVYDYESANVKGIGDIVEIFHESVPDFEIFTPNLSCNTSHVYAHFRESNSFVQKNKQFLDELARTESAELLHSYSAFDANDLCRSTTVLYPEINQYLKDGWFMTGSGCTVFRLDT